MAVLYRQPIPAIPERDPLALTGGQVPVKLIETRWGRRAPDYLIPSMSSSCQRTQRPQLASMPQYNLISCKLFHQNMIDLDPNDYYLFLNSHPSGTLCQISDSNCINWGVIALGQRNRNCKDIRTPAPALKCKGISPKPRKSKCMNYETFYCF